MKETEVSPGVVIQQEQQAPSTILPAQSVFKYNLAPEVLNDLEQWDAVVGSSAQVNSGLATHTSLNAAIAFVVSGGAIMVLRGTVTENVIVNKEVFIQGQGRGTVINGTVEFQNTSNYSTMQNMKLRNNLTLDSGTTGLYVITCFQANGFNILDYGVDNSIDIFQE
jgi:hypothetical protein